MASSSFGATGPKSQFIAWTGLIGAGVAFYIYVKGVNSSKKRLDMANTARSVPTNEDGTPLRRRGGAGVSSGSSAYALSTPPSQPLPEANFLQQPPVTPKTAPLTLAQYRAAVNAKRTVEGNREHFSTPHNA